MGPAPTAADDADRGLVFDDVDGQDGPGCSYLLRTDDGVFRTYRTERRGTEAILAVAHIWDRTVYGRRQDFEDSPDGWPQEPTCG